MQVDFLRVWFPPINLYSAPHAVKITRFTDIEMLQIPTKHEEFHKEWEQRGRPPLEWKLASEPESEYRPVNTELSIGIVWASVFDFRFAERRLDALNRGPETDLQRYWYRRGYNKALEDVRDKVTAMSAKRCLETD